MSSVEKYSNILDNKKEAAVTTPLSEKKSLTIEKVTNSYEVQKRSEKFTISEEVVKGFDKVQKHTNNITTNEPKFVSQPVCCAKTSANQN